MPLNYVLSATDTVAHQNADYHLCLLMLRHLLIFYFVIVTSITLIIMKCSENETIILQQVQLIFCSCIRQKYLSIDLQLRFIGCRVDIYIFHLTGNRIRYLLIARMLRLIRLLLHVQRCRAFVATFLTLIPSLMPYLGIIFCVLCIYCSLGLQVCSLTHASFYLFPQLYSCNLILMDANCK